MRPFPLPPSQPLLQFREIVHVRDDLADELVLLDRSFEEVGQDTGGDTGIDAGHCAGTEARHCAAELGVALMGAQPGVDLFHPPDATEHKLEVPSGFVPEKFAVFRSQRYLLGGRKK